MKEPNLSSINQRQNEQFGTQHFINEFKDLTSEDVQPLVFRELEHQLEAAGFELANANEVASILNDNTLMCRSEDIERALNLITENRPVDVLNQDLQANICKMSSTEGFRAAMTEGFGNKSVDGKVKVVISFKPDHVENHGPLMKESELWQLKPTLARVSIIGRGQIEPGDVKMISFRFPTHLYPEQLLSDEEAELLDNEGMPFVVRHYKKNIEKATQ